VIKVIKKLSVKNFKSIKELEIDCRKINLFIGEPNTGKSNILEALGLLSWCGHYLDQRSPLKEYVRFEYMQDLFYDNSTEEPIEIKVGDIGIGVAVKFEDDSFNLHFEGELAELAGFSLMKYNRLDYSGNHSGRSIQEPISELAFIKSYRFKEKQDKFTEGGSTFLMPPRGANMFAVVMGNKRFREIMAQYFRDFGYRLVLKTRDKTFEIQKQTDDVEDIVFSYPYISTSDTLQRMIFHTIAMESNKNCTLVFEEPESHAFPYYAKFLGEKIALDESNQYFIITHNPYLLLSILEKAPKDDVNVFVTYSRDYQTKVKCLSDEEISELMTYEPFFNLDSFIEEEEDEEEV